MLYKHLSRKHPSYDGERLRDYRALYQGIREVRKRCHSFLVQNEAEPDFRYAKRVAESVYHNYLGSIIDNFSATLFNQQLIQKAYRKKGVGEPLDPGEYYTAIQSDADGVGTDLSQFLADGFKSACVAGSSWWMVEFPPASAGAYESRFDQEAAGALDIKLRQFEAENVLNWKRDIRGNLEWVIIHEASREQDTPYEDELVTERWWLIDRASVTEYAARRKPHDVFGEEQDIPELWTYSHGMGEVPVVEMALPEGLWIANRVESPQVEHYRLATALSWNIKRTCFAMQVWHLLDGERPPVIGPGYAWQIGLEEKVSWPAPPTEHLQITADQVAVEKDEIYRIVGQMAQGVDNNASAVGRSGLSKKIDAESLRILLGAYGAVVREACERTYTLLSKARGDQMEWSVEGLDQFSVMDAETLIALLEVVLKFDIGSEAWLTEVKTRAAYALTPGLDQSAKDLIREEIAKAVKAQLQRSEEERQIELALAHAASRTDEDDRVAPQPRAPSGEREEPQEKAGDRGRGTASAPKTRPNRPQRRR